MSHTNCRTSSLPRLRENSDGSRNQAGSPAAHDAAWYGFGLRSGYRGRFGMYLPPLLEDLGLAEVTHDARDNRIRAL